MIENWYGADRAFTIKVFYKNNDIIEAVHKKFCHRFNLGCPNCVPSAHTMNTWVQNSKETSSALEKKPLGRVQNICMPQNIKTVQAPIIQKTKEGGEFITKMWMSNEDHLHLNGYVNMQN